MDMYDEPHPDRFDHVGSGGPPFGEAWRRCCDRLRAEVGDAVFNSWFGSLTLESVGSGQARLSVPTRFLKSWIVTHYAGHVASALNAEAAPPPTARTRSLHAGPTAGAPSSLSSIVIPTASNLWRS